MKKIYSKQFKKLILVLFTIFLNKSIASQTIYSNKSIDSVFTNYTKPFQEVVYAHLNKSKYIKGESIEFCIYTFDKQEKMLSNISKNLYCVISDENNNPIKKQLLKLENGVISGSIKLDSAFKGGTYTFKAYTNWLLNFAEHNYFADTFEIIDPNDTSTNSLKSTDKGFEIDAQILPESGHVVSDVLNTMGIIIKDKFGYGLPYLKGKLIDSNQKIITSFSLNKLGIGRFSFTPKLDQNYIVIIDNNGKEIFVDFNQNIEKKGVLLKVSKNNTHALISLVTNNFYISKFKNKKLQLAFHDGLKLNKFDFYFDNSLSITKKIPFKNLATGINIFTLFDEDNNPIAERLFFNYEGLKIVKSNVTSVNRKDTLISLRLNYNITNNTGFNNVSVSILPQQTKSYHKNTNIISQTLIQPYIRGTIENGGYYFMDINEQKKYDLDNLLITQGWSSYNWNSIFNSDNDLKYPFEKGVSIKVNIPKLKKRSAYLVHHISNRGPELINFEEEIKSFQMYQYYPEDNETLYISKVGKKGNLYEPSLYVQYFPSSVPNLNKQFKTLNPIKNYYAQEVFLGASNFENLNKVQVLNEIVIKANLEEKRVQSIKNKSFGRVFFLSENDRNMTLANYLNGKPGISASDNFQTNQFVVYNRIADGVPAMILDGFQVTKDQLFYYWLDIVDYIEINSTMTVGFITGRGGAINIYTDALKFMRSKSTVRKVEFPLTFSKPEKFYSPKYQSYTSKFYKEYGVVDWLPKNKIDENGHLEFNFTNTPLNKITLFIEGITEDGTFILEEKKIQID
jgi:hypothetical protein